MRVMPVDACYANLIVLAKYQVLENTLIVKLEAEVMPGLNNVDQFRAHVDSLASDEADEAGMKTLPLFAIRTLGRGAFGNSYRVRLTNNFSKKKNLPYRTYRLELLDAANGNIVDEAFDGCLYDHAVNSYSLLMDDVMDGDTVSSRNIAMYTCEDTIEKLYEAYCETFAEGEEVDVANFKLFDPIFGVSNDKVAHSHLVVDKEALALDRIDGVALVGGNDGALENPGDKTLEEIQEEIYIKAFRGELDKSILSPRRTPVKFILDANYPINVKRALVDLGLNRYDALIHLDAGIIHSHDEALIYGEETYDLNYRIVSKSYQHYQIRDPFTGKKVEVTMTYDLAGNLARHIETRGLATPYTGETYATLRGAVKGSLQPVLDESDEDLKEKLYDLRLNYYEAIAENVFARGTQQTAQEDPTDLSEENNMLIVLEIKDRAEKESIARRYNFAEPTDRQLFTEILRNKVVDLKSVVRSLEVYYDMSTDEELRSTIHCYIHVTFRTMAKSSIVEININKRG